MDLINHPTLLHWCLEAFPKREGVGSYFHKWGSTNSEEHKIRKEIRALLREYPQKDYTYRIVIVGYRGKAIYEYPPRKLKPGEQQQLESQQEHHTTT